MEKYSEMRKRHQRETDALPMQAAFGTEQFNAMLSRWGLTENDTAKVTALGYGMYCLNEDRPRIVEALQCHARELAEAMAADDDFFKGAVMAEMANHEYGYTGDITDTLRALDITPEQYRNDQRIKRLIDEAEAEYMARCED